LKEAGFEPDSSEIILKPNSTVEIAEDKQEAVGKFLEELESQEDVDNVYHDAV